MCDLLAEKLAKMFSRIGHLIEPLSGIYLKIEEEMGRRGDGEMGR
ncbi:hypothetical protein [Okeania sp. SIO2B3]|nr:hypothetical protein [Okeania sp. SIO2B3]